MSEGLKRGSFYEFYFCVPKTGERERVAYGDWLMENDFLSVFTLSLSLKVFLRRDPENKLFYSPFHKGTSVDT